jgi:hypothetical protein
MFFFLPLLLFSSCYPLNLIFFTFFEAFFNCRRNRGSPGNQSKTRRKQTRQFPTMRRVVGLPCSWAPFNHMFGPLFPHKTQQSFCYPFPQVCVSKFSLSDTASVPPPLLSDHFNFSFLVCQQGLARNAT